MVQSSSSGLLRTQQGLAVNGQGHGIQAIVHINYTAGDGRCQWGQQEGCCIANFSGLKLLLNWSILI